VCSSDLELHDIDATELHVSGLEIVGQNWAIDTVEIIVRGRPKAAASSKSNPSEGQFAVS
jgi:hypothetical protein